MSPAGAPAGPAASALIVWIDPDIMMSPPRGQRPPWVDRFPGLLAAALLRAGYRPVEDRSLLPDCGLRAFFKPPDLLGLHVMRRGIAIDTFTTQVERNPQTGAWALPAAVHRLVAEMTASPRVAAITRGPGMPRAPAPPSASAVAPVPGSAPRPATPEAQPSRPLALASPQSLLFLPLKAVANVSPAVCELVGNFMLAQLDTVAGLKTFAKEDVETMLGVEKQRDALGCVEVSCMAEIGGSLGADLILYGEVGLLGSHYNVNVTVVHARAGGVGSRVGKLLPRDDDALAAAVPGLVADIIDKLNNRP